MSANRSDPSGSAGAQHPERAQKGPSDRKDSPIQDPGSLRGSAWLTLQTRHAGRLVKGRPGQVGKPPIIGLLGFAERLRIIWQGTLADDPYAEWWLVKVDRVLARAAADLEALRTSIDERFVSHEGLEIEVPESQQPTRVKLQFANPYAYRGAQLLAAYDGCVRRVLSARHVALVDREEAERYLRRGAKPLRHAFGSALGYRFLGVNRVEIAQQTARAKQAAESMGELPPEILSGALRASLLPNRVVAASETVVEPRPDASVTTE